MLSSLILHRNKPFLERIVTWDEKWIVYNNWHFPKPNLHPKRVMVTVWWSPARLIHYSFLNLGKTITSEKFAQHVD